MGKRVEAWLVSGASGAVVSAMGASGEAPLYEGSVAAGCGKGQSLASWVAYAAGVSSRLFVFNNLFTPEGIDRSVPHPCAGESGAGLVA